MYQFTFEKLDVWQLARVLVNLIYEKSFNFPEREKFNLESQIKRAAVSVMNNIAEGSGRTSMKEQARFTEISYASLMEVMNCSIIAKDQNFFIEQDLMLIRQQVSTLGSKLINYRRSQLRRIN